MSKPEIKHINSWEVDVEGRTPAMKHYLQIKKKIPGFYYGIEWEIFTKPF